MRFLAAASRLTSILTPASLLASFLALGACGARSDETASRVSGVGNYVCKATGSTFTYQIFADGISLNVDVFNRVTGQKVASNVKLRGNGGGRYSGGNLSITVIRSIYNLRHAGYGVASCSARR